MLNYGINAWNKTWSHPLLSNQQVSNSARCLKAVHCLTFNLSWCWHIPKEVDRLLIVIRAKEFSSRGKCGQSRWSLACCSYHRFTHGKLKYSTLTALSLFLFSMLWNRWTTISQAFLIYPCFLFRTSISDHPNHWQSTSFNEYFDWTQF